MDINIIKESIKILEEFDPTEYHSENEIKLFKQAINNAVTSMNYILVAHHLTKEMIDKTEKVEEEIKSDPDRAKVVSLLNILLPYDWEDKVLVAGINYHEEIDKSGIWYEIAKDYNGKLYNLIWHNGKNYSSHCILYSSDSFEEIIEELKKYTNHAVKEGN